jgi:hypothetical protein
LAGLILIRDIRIFLILAVLAFPSEAHAYVDPGAGSLIYQTLLAVLLGLGFVLRSTREKIARMMKGLFSRRSNSAETPSNERL